MTETLAAMPAVEALVASFFHIFTMGVLLFHAG